VKTTLILSRLTRRLPFASLKTPTFTLPSRVIFSIFVTNELTARLALLGRAPTLLFEMLPLRVFDEEFGFALGTNESGGALGYESGGFFGDGINGGHLRQADGLRIIFSGVCTAQ